jgi:uncharacterized protein
VRWTWNGRKDAANRAKHGLPLSLGVAGLDDPMSVSVSDPHPDGDRWNTVCQVADVVLFVVHTWPDDEEDVEGRIISVRRDAS